MTKGIVDNIADFLISIVTDYGTAIGCDHMIESTLVGKNNRGGSDSGVVGDRQNNRIFQSDGGLLESITESRPVMCFECGVARATANHSNSNNNGVDVAEYTGDDDKQFETIVSSLPGSDLVFFPTPSSEVPHFFHHHRHPQPQPQPQLPPPSFGYHHHQQPNSIPSAYPLSRTSEGLISRKKGRDVIDYTEMRHNNGKIGAATPILGVGFSTHHSVSSPPPDVADRWLKMGRNEYNRIENDNRSVKSNHDVMCDEEMSYAFDEISLGNSSGRNNDHKHHEKQSWVDGDIDRDDTHYPFDERGGSNGPLLALGIRTPQRHDVMSSPFSSSSCINIKSRSGVRPPLAYLSPNSTRKTSSHSVGFCPQRQRQQQQQQQELTRKNNNIISTSNRNTNQWFCHQQEQQLRQQQHRDRRTNHRRGAELGGGLTNRIPLRGDTMSFVSSSSSSSAGVHAKTSNAKKDDNVGSVSVKSHWKSATDPKSGKTYYYHEVTRETQWRKPLELATDEEKRAMAEKERKQKDFFAAMEANILNAVSQGVMPGTQGEETGGIGRSGSGGSGSRGFGRRMSSRRVSVGPDGRPELVRTISTMDELVLKDLILRQPSYRNMKPGLSKEESLRIEDLATAPSRASSGVRDGLGMGDSWSQSSQNKINNTNVMPTLQESMREYSMNDSMPELFSYLPDDEDLSTSYGDDDDDDDDYSEYDDASTSRRTDDDSEFNKSKGNNSAGAVGFGLSKGESQALKKLSSITKDMIYSEKSAYNIETTPAGGATPSKPKRDLPREVDFDDSDDDDDDESSRAADGKALPTTTAVKAKPPGTPIFQKATESGSDGRAFPREIELDFEDSDEEEEDGDNDYKDNTANSKPVGNSKLPLRDEKSLQSTSDELKRPDVKRRNTCSTMYVGTTMSAPDKDATIKCVCGVYRSHILSSAQFNSIYNPDTDPYKIFNDQQDGQKKSQRLPSTSTTGSVVPIPSLDEITKFYRDIFFKAQMETDCIIMSIIYVERLIKKTVGKLRPRAENWHSLLFSCMILSSKVWDDLSMWNVDFSQSCPPGVSFSLQRINELELAVLNALSFKVKVKASEYAKYYFLLRSMLIKSGLAGDDLLSLDPLDVHGARRLQEVSSQFENLSLGNNGTTTGTGTSMMSKVRPIQDRSKSLDVRNIGLQQQHQQKTRTTAGLEQVVKM